MQKLSEIAYVRTAHIMSLGQVLINLKQITPPNGAQNARLVEFIN